ncbi:hypothetical protein [Virgisporangium aliadipatigenens]|nr:hypothetical protein [Virgisporangium aliadipatigenens]
MRRILLAVVVIATATLLPVHPAAASDVTPQQGRGYTVRATSEHDTRAEKTARVECPVPTRVVDVSATINDGYGDVVLTALRPNADLTGGVARARDAAGSAGTWSVTVTARCVVDVTPVLVSETETVTDGEHTVSATCPVWTRLRATGFDVTGDAVPYEVAPVAGARTVRVGARTLTTAEYSTTAVAICEPAVDTAGGAAPVSVAEPARAVDGAVPPGYGVMPFVLVNEGYAGQSTVTVGPCPAGTEVRGGGGSISGSYTTGLVAVTVDHAAETVTVSGGDYLMCCAYPTVIAYAVCS